MLMVLPLISFFGSHIQLGHVWPDLPDPEVHAQAEAIEIAVVGGIARVQLGVNVFSLAAVSQRLDVAEVRILEAVVGAGTALYAAVVTAGLEGVVVKLPASPYHPDKRSVAWRRIKPRPRGRSSARAIPAH
jgi:hypothetical protein